jgi:hypothetical protein
VTFFYDTLGIEISYSKSHFSVLKSCRSDFGCFLTCTKKVKKYFFHFFHFLQKTPIWYFSWSQYSVRSCSHIYLCKNLVTHKIDPFFTKISKKRRSIFALKNTLIKYIGYPSYKCIYRKVLYHRVAHFYILQKYENASFS